MAKRSDITAEYVRQILDYDPETGVLRWKVSKRKGYVGRIAGKVEYDGYLRVGVNGRLYPAHRLAWLLVNGAFPESHIDHINGDRADNRICNLRLATQSQNIANARIGVRNKTGFKGVSKTKDGRYYASIKIDGKGRNLGFYDTPEEAHAAYMKVARDIFKEFARAG